MGVAPSAAVIRVRGEWPSSSAGATSAPLTPSGLSAPSASSAASYCRDLCCAFVRKVCGHFLFHFDGRNFWSVLQGEVDLISATTVVLNDVMSVISRVAI